MSDAYEAQVDQLVQAKVGRAAAEKHVRTNYPDLARAHDSEQQRRAGILEKEEQAAVVKLFREHGFTVRSTSQARRSKIALGFPDLFVTHKTKPVAFFFETKRQVGGIVSEAQQDFGDDCRRCGVRWFAGDRFAAQKVLDELGLTR